MVDLADRLEHYGDYDAVVLAAGRNTRLKGLVPSYHKPLMIVNGRPLIVSIVAELRNQINGRIAVVVSPENCQAVSEILHDCHLLADQRVFLLVQPVARGPGDGLQLAWPTLRYSRTIIVCADNVIPAGELKRVIEEDRQRVHQEALQDQLVTLAFVKQTDEAAASRFTRILDTAFIEGEPGGWREGYYRCWVGPLIVPHSAFWQALESYATACLDAEPVKEIKISPALNYIHDRRVHLVPGGSFDIGTSDALFQVTQEEA